MALATADADGLPNVRMVLLKGFDQRGFVFYTNLESRKGTELSANPHAALCFHWKSLRRSVRIEGRVEQVTDAESDAYYNSRPRGSRIGAWASQQSRRLPEFSALQDAVKFYEDKFEGIEDIPRPAYWRGYRVIPDKIEFWVDGEFRLHRRYVFLSAKNGWDTHMIYP
jgi:pyridoxamine 5'-phosphate oxidase